MRETEGLYRFARLLKRLALGALALAAGVVVFGYLFFVRQVNKEEAWTDAERELRGDMLQYGEKVGRIAHVYIRRPTNYFRGANGVLAATPRRVLYVGLEPRDKLASADAPAAILTDEFPNDTGLVVNLGRVYLLTAEGVTLKSGGRSATFAAARGHEAELDSLARYVESTIAQEKRDATAELQLRQQIDSIQRLPIHYVVRKGDALSTIATRFGATQDEIRQWNRLSNDRVKIGHTLLVKPEGVRAPVIVPSKTPVVAPVPTPPHDSVRHLRFHPKRRIHMQTNKPKPSKT